jgi:hypothetical protein
VALTLIAAALPPLARASTGNEASCMPVGAQLLISVAMLCLTCALHAWASVLQAELSHRPRLRAWCSQHSLRRFLLIVLIALVTGFALLLEVLLWALLYRGLGLMPSLEASLYFSGITFTTVGYGDMTLPDCWRLLSVGEAVNGVLMAGWSTAQLITVVQHMMELRLISDQTRGQRNGLQGGD